MAIIVDLFTRKVLAVNPKLEVRERLEARFGDNLPKHFKRCMEKPQSKPYMYGDPHNVTYKKTTKLFNSPMPVPCEVTETSCKKFNNVLILGDDCELGIDEPFPWMDLKYQVSLNFLKSLPDKTKLIVYTRSDLVAHDDYIQEFKRLDVSINILAVTSDDALNRVNEPGAPSYARRVKAVKELTTNGIQAKIKWHAVNEKEVG